MPRDASPFAIDAVAEDLRLVVAVTGEIDAATAPRLEDEVHDRSEGMKALDLDLSGVTFIDSSGLRSLLAVRTQADQDGMSVRLVAASDLVLRLLDVTGLTDLFPTG